MRRHPATPFGRDVAPEPGHARRVITVHHLEDSRSQRILWLLEELEVAYEIKRYERDASTRLAPPALRAIHPLGKSPLVQDGDRVVAETGAIITYLLDTYGEGRLRPEAGTPQRQQYEFWLHYAEGSLMPLLLVRLIFDRIRKAPLPFFIKPVAKLLVGKVDDAFTSPQLNLHYDYINDQLNGTEWLVGDALTAADIQMSFPLEAGRTRMDYSAYPHIDAFVRRVHARPAYLRALEKGGPYAYGPAAG